MMTDTRENRNKIVVTVGEFVGHKPYKVRLEELRDDVSFMMADGENMDEFLAIVVAMILDGELACDVIGAGTTERVRYNDCVWFSWQITKPGSTR